MKPIMCPCGFEKDIVYGIAICAQHCDAIACKGAIGRCPRCIEYNARIHNRTTAEYAREKNHG